MNLDDLQNLLKEGPVNFELVTHQKHKQIHSYLFKNGTVLNLFYIDPYYQNLRFSLKYIPGGVLYCREYNEPLRLNHLFNMNLNLFLKYINEGVWVLLDSAMKKIKKSVTYDIFV